MEAFATFISKKAAIASKALMMWAGEMRPWLKRVGDWFDAVCHDNNAGVRYEYENRRRDQVEFFVNVYQHVERHATSTICDGSAERFARLFLHERFPGLLLVLLQRLASVPSDLEEFDKFLSSGLGSRLAFAHPVFGEFIRSVLGAEANFGSDSTLTHIEAVLASLPPTEL